MSQHETPTPGEDVTTTADGPSAPSRGAVWKRRVRSVGRLQRTAAIVPIAVLSVAWTASLTGVSLSEAAVSGLRLPTPAARPDVPAKAIDAPASISTTPAVGAPTRTVADISSAADTDAGQIPSVALAAYQRAQTVIDAADPTCNLTWQLLAAIGDVESDHGRAHGSTLATNGVVHPAIYGVPLKIADTDAGLIDGVKGYDRAVGPMQFIPSTWQAVAVDADNDGKRDPQDINDAALGAAVYLCSGPGDLSTTAGQKAAVYRYNHSTSYVTLVLAIMRAYLSGDYLASPDSTAATGYLTPNLGADLTSTPRRHRVRHDDAAPQSPASPSSTPSSSSTPKSDHSGSHHAGSTKHTGGQHQGNQGNQGQPRDPGKPDIPGAGGTNTPQLPHAPKTGIKPVDTLLTATQAALQCTLDGYIDNPLVSDDKYDICVTDYETTGQGPDGEKPSSKVLADN